MTLPDALRGQPVLVTGANGFLGRHVAALGVLLGAEVHALVRARSGAAPVAPIGGAGGAVRSWPADLLEPRAVRDVVATLRPRAILHLAAAGVVGATPPDDELLRVNAVGLATLLGAAQALDPAPAVVVAGSGFEYGEQARPLREDDPLRPSSAYGVSKAAASLVAARFGRTLPMTVLRLFGIYGPGERPPRVAPYVVGQARRGEPVELTAGEQLRDFTFVADAAGAFWAALAVPPPPGEARFLNVGSQEPRTLAAFVELVAAALRRRGLAPDLRFGARPYRPGEPMVYCADPTRAAAALGWRATTSLEDGVERTVEACLADAR